MNQDNAFKRQQELVRLERYNKIVSLITAGATLKQVAEELGLYDESHARKWVHKAFAALAPNPDDVRYARQVARVRYTAILRSWWGRATGPKAEERAAVLVLKTMEQLAKLEGTDAPIQHRHGQAQGAGPVQLTIVDQSEIAELSDEDLARAIAEANEAVTRAIAAAKPAAGAGAETAAEAEDGGVPGEPG